MKPETHNRPGWRARGIAIKRMHEFNTQAVSTASKLVGGELERGTPPEVIVANWTQVRADVPVKGLTRVAGTVARSISSLGYGHLLKAHQKGASRPRQAPASNADINALLLELEHYDLALRATRTAARAGDVDALQTTQMEVIRRLQGPLRRLVGTTASIPSTTQMKSLHAATLCAFVARRCAWLAGAITVLQARLSTPTTAHTTPDLAARRVRLRRRYMQPDRAMRSFRGLSAGTAISIVGRIEKIDWLERPKVPATDIVLAGSKGGIVRFPYRSLPNVGVVAGAALWARGIIKPSADAPVLEIEQEGPTTHDHEVWEDWLAQETRTSFDLYPASAFAEWELPSQSDVFGRNDLLARWRAGAPQRN